jgi:protoheme IX farnesyltransferase
MTDVRAVPLAAARTWGRRAGAFVALTKPRIIELLLVTTVPAMIVAEGGLPAGTLIVATVVGGTLAAGGANTFNMYADRDIDRLMERTRNRPLVTGEVEPAHALVFGAVLEVAAFALLWSAVNLLSALLAVSACLFYVFVYTLWLKRTSRQNIVIGGAAGAVPVLVGWAAVTGELALTAWLLFAVVFFWTPPHFWALAIKYRADYEAANVPMLPVVVSVRTTARQMLAYTVVVAALAVAVWPVADLGWIYGAAAVVASGVFLLDVGRLVGDPTPRRAMRVFGFSITYLTVLFGALAADVLVLQGL